MLREFSAGALVFRRMQDQWWAAVIEPGREGEPEDRKHVIALPKGNVDSGEKPSDTAIREVQEETGLKASLVAKLADIKYVYSRKWQDNARVFKVVSFFLMEYQAGEIGNIKEEMRHEVRRAWWMPLEEAAAKLSYGGEKEVAKKALEYLKNGESEASAKAAKPNARSRKRLL
jgi:8-oxo-dGTP pyrophosphatase MutT (NUDIX family)